MTTHHFFPASSCTLHRNPLVLSEEDCRSSMAELLAGNATAMACPKNQVLMGIFD